MNQTNASMSQVLEECSTRVRIECRDVRLGGREVRQAYREGGNYFLTNPDEADAVRLDGEGAASLLAQNLLWLYPGFCVHDRTNPDPELGFNWTATHAALRLAGVTVAAAMLGLRFEFAALCLDTALRAPRGWIEWLPDIRDNEGARLIAEAAGVRAAIHADIGIDADLRSSRLGRDCGALAAHIARADAIFELTYDAVVRLLYRFDCAEVVTWSDATHVLRASLSNPGA